MKVGILTQPMHWNYGGILQNWALQQVLREMGHEPIKLERVGNSISMYRKIKADVKTRALRLFGEGRNRALTHLFAPTRLSLKGLDLRYSRNIYDSGALKKVAKRVDAIIVGSDQVWRQDYSPCITDFFLGFTDNTDSRPRISYAASFGKADGYMSEDKMDECRKLIKRFSSISVRENEGIDILRDDFDISDVSLVLDPTLLLSAKDYVRIMPCEKKAAKPYISAYILDETVSKLELLNKVMAHSGIAVYDLIGTKFDKCAGARVPSIGEWISSIANAKIVVTDSFHGMVFSLIFHRPFVVIANAERGIDRYRTLLEPLGLMDRLVCSKDMDIEAILSQDIDWAFVNSYLNEQKTASKMFLKASLRQ